MLGVVMDRCGNAAQMQTQRAGVESGIHEEAGHWVCSYRLAIDGGDEHALVAADAHAVLTPCGEELREAGCGLGALRFVCGKKDEQVRIIATQPGNELAVAENDLGIGSARQDPWG